MFILNWLIQSLVCEHWGIWDCVLKEIGELYNYSNFHHSRDNDSNAFSIAN
ncbi:hypothetical protein LguiA_029789 [Lonicera macranthoides]